MEVSREERCDLGQLLSVLGTEKGRKVSGNRTSMRVAQCYKETSFNKVPEHGCHFFLSTASPIEYASCKSVKTNLVSLNIRAKICRFLYVRVNMYKYCLFFFQGSTAIVAKGLLISDLSRSPSDTPQSVGLLWTRDRPVTETSTWQHKTLTTDSYLCPRRYSNPQTQQASGRRHGL